MAFTKATFDYLDSGGLINWITTAKTSAFTAVSGEGYLVDTSSAAVTVTLPTSPSAGDEIIIVDYASNAGTNNITLDPGTLNLRGATDDFVMSNNNQSVRLLYSGATKGWLVTSDAGAGAAAAPDLTVDYLVVAGGGGGGGQVGGGGGAGGLRTTYTNSSSLSGHTESTLTLLTSANYTLTVGAGGAAGEVGGGSNSSGGEPGVNGNDSVFSTITSKGGGYGGAWATTNGNTGGSGGGGGASSISAGAGGSALTSPIISGYSGGSGTQTYWGGGGGGGASAAGGNSTSNLGGSGGAGLAVNILNTTNATTGSVGEVSGSDVYFAGGGGGGGQTSSNIAQGGIGGGGNGGYTVSTSDYSAPTNGNSNTGGGGGGSRDHDVNSVFNQGGPVGAGGSGVVILRYPSAFSITVGSGITEASGSPFTEGSDKVSVFTGGTGTISFS